MYLFKLIGSAFLSQMPIRLMKKNMKKFLLTALLIAVLSPLKGQNAKQEYTNFKDSVFTLKEVVVIQKEKAKAEALKLDIPIKFLPISTHFISRNLLEKRDIRDIQEAARYLPGVRFRTSYGAFTQFSVRGFDNSVIMIDGIRDERSSIDNSYPFMDLSSVESIELIKGPSSVLYGQSAVGGIINVVRKNPISQNNVYARIGYGSFYNKQATFTFGGKLLGPLNYRAHINYQDEEGWRDNATKRLSGYLAIGGQLTEKDKLDIRIGANRDFYSTEIGLPPTVSSTIYSATDGSQYLSKGDMLPGLDRKARYNSESDFMYNKNINASLLYKHSFNSALQLTNKLSYTYDDIDYFGTEELSYLTSSNPIYPHYYLSKDKSGIEKKTYICLDSIQYSYPLRFSHIAKTVNNQLELNGKFDWGKVRHNYLIGYSLIGLFRDSYKAYGNGSTGVSGPGSTGHGSTYHPHSIGWMDSNFRFVSVQRTWTQGFYIQDLMEFSKQFKVMLAGRYDLFNYRTANVETNGNRRDYDNPDENLFSKTRTSALSYRIGAVYLPIEQLSVYSSFSTYFKPIRKFYSANTIYIDKNGNEFTPVDGKEIFKPEEGFQAEIGARYELSDKLQVGTSLFFINKINIQQRLANKGDNVNGTIIDKNVDGQVGRMNSRGFDIDINWTPMRELLFSIGYGYTNAKVRDLSANKYMASSQMNGKQFPHIPQNTFYTYGNYTVSKGCLKNLELNYSTTFQDKVYRNSDNSTQFDAYWLTNLGIAYTLPNKIRMGININNLFNKSYYDQALGNQYVPSKPRSFMASLSYTL